MKVHHEFPLSPAQVREVLNELHFDPERLSIREVNRLVFKLEDKLGLNYVRMEFGIPNLDISEIAIKNEKEAIDRGVTARYPPFDGIPELKEAGVNFIKAFMDVELPTHCVVPSVGAMQGGLVSQAIAGRRHNDRKTILFLEPSFPVTKLQTSFLGLRYDALDLYYHRGDKLIEAVRERFEAGGVGGMIWSSPNNPSWLCLKDSELEGLGQLCNEYGVLAIEDLAYLGMDFRRDYGKPNEPPFIPTIARYSDEYVIIISSAKVFNYPGQRIGFVGISPSIFHRSYPDLKPWFQTEYLGHAFVHGGIYCTTAGVAHSAQWGLTALLNAATSGEFDFLNKVRVYGDRAKHIKKLFLDHDFKLVYDNDLGEPLADGFYLTLSYPGMDGRQLLLELLRHGISTITLASTGSLRTEGVRACVSFTTEKQFPIIESRIKQFKEDHPL